jgi:hypothetical protein
LQRRQRVEKVNPTTEPPQQVAEALEVKLKLDPSK